MSEHLPIEKTKVYGLFVSLADEIWDVVSTWKSLAQSTVGNQLVRAMDSIGANLVEGDGRYGSADSIHFFIIARGSAREAAYWLRRARKRKLITESTASNYLERLDHATRGLNNLISYRRSASTSKVKETSATYAQVPEHLTPNTEHPLPAFTDEDLS